jgi:hypothetical protein
MQKFKLSWMALLRNDEHARLIEQLCGILDDCPIDNPYVPDIPEVCSVSNVSNVSNALLPST